MTATLVYSTATAAPRLRPVRWRDLWARDSRQPVMPPAVRGAHLVAVDVPAGNVSVGRRLVAALPSHLPAGFVLIGGFTPAAVAPDHHTIRLIFALHGGIDVRDHPVVF